MSDIRIPLNESNPTSLTPTDEGTGPPHDDHTESPQPQRSSPPTRTSMPSLKSTTEHPTSIPGSSVVPVPVGPGDFLPGSSTEPLPNVSLGSTHALDNLAKAWNDVRDGPSDSNLNRHGFSGATVENPQSDIAPLQPVITVAAEAVEQTPIVKSVKDRIDHFFDDVPVLLTALDEVAKLYPFIGVLVLTFRTASTLEMSRRRKEKKITAVYVEMMDMMSVLLLFNNLIAPDGMSIGHRLRSLVEQTADDIKFCSNVCFTYGSKRPLAKVLLASIWDAKLLELMRLFNRRRQEFEFELSLHQPIPLDRLDAVVATFDQLVSPEQKELSALVTMSGGVEALRNNDKVLLALEETANRASSTPGAEGHRALGTRVGDTDDLKTDIFEDPTFSVERSQGLFFRRFEALKIRTLDKLMLAVKRDSDRIIEEGNGGPHEQIRDRSIHEIWKAMGWRWNVKARHFVLALRDYYLALQSSQIRGVSASTMIDSQNSDAWAIKYIDIVRLQPILEAIDDDASGFITIKEINQFTSSRPEDWSMLHWVAFWAVGFRASIIHYAKRIEELFAKMEGVRSHVLPPNREAIDDYFTYVWDPIHTLTAAVVSLQPGPDNPDKFKPYLEAEEARLSANLKAVDHIIDGTDSLTLITGVGCIEKNLFPLLYLLMKRHYEIMRIMLTKRVDSRELSTSSANVLYLRDVIRHRVDDLANTFSQQRLDPEKQFRTFAHGIFKYIYNDRALWSVEYVRSLISPVIAYNHDAEDPNVNPEDILQYETMEELSLDLWVYDGHSVDDIPIYSDVGSASKDILGHWHGYFYEINGVRGTNGPDSMVTMVLEPADNEHDLKANAWSNRGRHIMNGSWTKRRSNALQIKLKMTFAGTLWSPMFFDGHFDPKRDALTGGVLVAFAASDTPGGKMEFRRIPPSYLTVYPSIKELSHNRPRALWRFAIAAVRNDVRRDSWSWSFFSQRRDDRETVISLTIRSLYFGKRLDDNESEELCETVQRLTSADACFYNSKINLIHAHTRVHMDVWCDSCDGRIGGARLFCLDCANKNTAIYNVLDLCSRPECIAERVTHRQDIEGAHEPNHKLVKVRTVVLKRQHGRAHTVAKKAFERTEMVCKQIVEASKQPDTRSNVKSLEYTTRASSFDMWEGSQPSPQNQSGDLPTCGACIGPLSFPFWSCTFCKDLFICDLCDTKGVPDLMFLSGKHTEEHHLIRCLAPEAKEVLFSTEK